jgi:preprotein translocase subunit SecE
VLNKKIDMNSVVQFVKDSWREVTTEVTWPKWGDLQSSATIVLVASLIFALVVGSIDFLIDNALRFLFKSL